MTYWWCPIVMPWLGHGIQVFAVDRGKRRGCRACARHDGFGGVYETTISLVRGGVNIFLDTRRRFVFLFRPCQTRPPLQSQPPSAGSAASSTSCASSSITARNSPPPCSSAPPPTSPPSHSPSAPATSA